MSRQRWNFDFTFLKKSRDAKNVATRIVAAPNLQPLTRFPKPNLQIDDSHNDSTFLHTQQISKLNSYGWVDRSNEIVRIPISRAMDLILQNGLPTRTNGVSQTDGSPL